VEQGTWSLLVDSMLSEIFDIKQQEIREKAGFWQRFLIKEVVESGLSRQIYAGWLSKSARFLRRVSSFDAKRSREKSINICASHSFHAFLFPKCWRDRAKCWFKVIQSMSYELLLQFQCDYVMQSVMLWKRWCIFLSDAWMQR